MVGVVKLSVSSDKSVLDTPPAVNQSVVMVTVAILKSRPILEVSC